MRKIIGIFFLVVSLTATAQQPVVNTINPYTGNTKIISKKWSLTKYAGLSSGYGFFNGGNATIISAPIGVQLNRKITNNLFAFAGVSVAPTYVGFANQFMNTSFKPGSSFLAHQGGKWTPVSRAEFGLMYINDERTFSVSGSIGVQRGGYLYNPQQFMLPVHQNPAIRTK